MQCSRELRRPRDPRPAWLRAAPLGCPAASGRAPCRLWRRRATSSRARAPDPPSPSPRRSGAAACRATAPTAARASAARWAAGRAAAWSTGGRTRDPAAAKCRATAAIRMSARRRHLLLRTRGPQGRPSRSPDRSMGRSCSLDCCALAAQNPAEVSKVWVPSRLRETRQGQAAAPSWPRSLGSRRARRRRSASGTSLAPDCPSFPRRCPWCQGVSPASPGCTRRHPRGHTRRRA
mmetsp:Transcript_131769/g.421595  ORF Transcript_131769/g.421595 Transcript_131769/m.421595 type:complete len:234 (-) Transcript_131769:3834-4535(-)